jgi:hypothetical protein
MRPGIVGRFGLVLLCLALLPGCDDPQAPAPSGPVSSGAYSPGDGTLEFEIQSRSGEPTSLRLMARDVRFDSETATVHALVALHNAGSDPVEGPNAVIVSNFRPRGVAPVNASQCTQQGCVYVYDGTYGSDGLLDPGETSEFQEWIILNPSGQGFAFRLELDQVAPGGVIAGTVYDDRNGDGRRAATEPGVPQREVVAEGPDGRHAAVTDERGNYIIQVSQAGLYHVAKTPHDSQIGPSPPPYEVIIIERPDGSLSSFRGADFACRQPGRDDGIPIAGVVYNDIDRDGERGPGEPGVARFLVSAAALQCPSVAPIEAISNARGHFEMRLPDCEPPYEVSIVVRDGYVATTPAVLILEQRPAAGEPLRVEFGVASERIGFVVAGHVFWDRNGNGVRDHDANGFFEEGIPEIEITVTPLLCDGNPELPTLVTSSGGGYKWFFRGNDACTTLFWLERAPIVGSRDTTPNPVLVAAPPPSAEQEVIVDFGVQRLDP